MRPRRIEVEIGELVLHGIETAEAARLGEAVSRRLEASLRRDPTRLRVSDAPVVESARANGRGLSLPDLIAASVDGALRT